MSPALTLLQRTEVKKKKKSERKNSFAQQLFFFFPVESVRRKKGCVFLLYIYVQIELLLYKLPFFFFNQEPTYWRWFTPVWAIT